jgi:hypothetical protein
MQENLGELHIRQVVVSGIYKEFDNEETKVAININRHLSKEDMQLANKFREKCSTSLIIRKLKIKVQEAITS